MSGADFCTPEALHVHQRADAPRESPLKEETMTTVHRFVLDDERNIAATELKVTERTLDRWRRLGEGPRITKLGQRTIYRRTSLQAWIHAREKSAYVAGKAVRHA